MNYENKSVKELKSICKERKIKNYSRKKKKELIELLNKDDKSEIVTINNEEDNKIRYIDLFAGTGAFHFVFDNYDNYKCVFSNDFDKNSEIIYKENFKDCNFSNEDLSDISNENIPKHNILIAGFPCQPFSIAGKQEGFNDERSNVFWKILSIVKHHGPEIIILENVKNLLSHDNKKTFKTIYDNLVNLDYKIKYEILDTSVYSNIPQHRERIYIVCFKNNDDYNKFNFNFEKVDNNPIINYLEDDIIDKYYYTDKLKIYNNIVEHITKNISENILYQYRRYYVRENKNNKCPTLTANMGTGGHNVPLLKDNKGIRKLTPRECFNLQGFSKKYILPKKLSDSALYKLAGNAVSIPIIEKIIDKINIIFQENHQK